MAFILTMCAFAFIFETDKTVADATDPKIFRVPLTRTMGQVGWEMA
jgi:hypothetical protein